MHSKYLIQILEYYQILVSEDDQELAARIINEENLREEHLRGNSKHHIRVKGETINTITSKLSKNGMALVRNDRLCFTLNNRSIACAENATLVLNNSK